MNDKGEHDEALDVHEEESEDRHPCGVHEELPQDHKEGDGKHRDKREDDICQVPTGNIHSFP